MIQCPNHTCQASNAETDRFCHRCRAPLPRRLLWAVGHRADTFTPGDVLAGRYLCKASRIFLDQQPGIPPGTLTDVPKAVLPYLHLISYQEHLPQVYGWVDAKLNSGEVTRLMLLENAALLSTTTPPSQAYPIDLTRTTQPDSAPNQLPCLLPSLQRAWPHASAGQQLNWLWQLARLWAPLVSEQVAATLLKEKLIRVEGPLIRILELRFGLNTLVFPTSQLEDRPNSISAQKLSQLGSFWSALMDYAAPEIQEFGQSLCQHMIEERLVDPEILQDILTDAMYQVGRSQVLQVGIATQTDKGPSRSGNEDACFPTEGSAMLLPNTLNTSEDDGWVDNGLVIVCDGIGGHQGGAVASDLAIKTIAQQVQQSNHHRAGVAAIHADLKQAIAQANDVISQSNDDKQRRDRQRMGTTVVMGLLHGRDCYITHVGDSRAYWITQWGCHQLTLDDDVVSRETRLGYGTYRNILYQPNSGALVQALGMGPSKNLYPTVQRVMLEGEGLLLLCSDGLSDQDLIEACWEEVLRPVLLDEESDLGEVSQRLIDLANTHNGHDNVTVGIMHWQIRQTAPVQLAGAIDLSEFITQEMDSQPLAQTGRRPNTALSPLPDSQEMRGMADVSASSSDRSSPAYPRTVTQNAAPNGQADSHSNQQGSQANLRSAPDPSEAGPSTPVIGLQGLNIDVPQPEPLAGNVTANHQAAAPPSIWLRVMVVMVAIASLGMVSLLAYVWVPAISDRVHRILGIESPTRPRDTESNDLDGPGGHNLTTDPSASPADVQPFGIGSIIQLKSLSLPPSSTTDGIPLDSSTQQPLMLLALDPTVPESSPAESSPAESSPAESSPTELPPAEPPPAELTPLEEQGAESLPSPPVLQPQVLGTVPWGSVLVVKGSFEVPEQALNGEVPNGQVERDRATDGRVPDGRVPDGRVPDGRVPDGLANPIDGSQSVSDDRVVLMAGRWLEVQLCAVPTPSSLPDSASDLSLGTIGWVPESALRPLSQHQFSPSTVPSNLCELSPDYPPE